MPTIACPNRQFCSVGAADFGALYDLDFPIENRSSEGGDGDLHVSWFFAKGCLSVCYSTFSQQLADLCAQRQALSCCNPETQDCCDPLTNPDCQTDCDVDPETCPCPNPLRDDCPCIPSVEACDIPAPPPTPAPPNPPTPPNPPPNLVYLNTAQTCTVTCPDGGSFSYTVAAGLFGDYTQAGADLKAYTYACRQATLARICLSGIDDSGTSSSDKVCINEAYSRTIIVSGSETPASIVLQSGALPTGLDLTQFEEFPDRVFVEGTPTAAGTFTFTIRATLLSGAHADRTYTLHVVSIDTVSFPNGTQGTAYSETLTETGGVDPVSWQVVSGTLPTGLTLNPSSGEISGTPTVAGTFNFTIRLTDSP